MHHFIEGTAEEVFQKFQAGQIPPTAKVEVIWDEAKAAETKDDAAPSQSLEILLESIRQEFSVNREATLKRMANLAAAREETLAMFEKWQEEDAQMTPEERAEEDRTTALMERDGFPRFNLPDRLSHGDL